MDKFLTTQPIKAFCLIVVLLLLPMSVSAQTADRHLTLLGIPSATIAPHGTGFVTLQYTNQRPGPATGSDAALSFGVGFGDAENTLGVQLSAEITSTTNNLGDSGYFDLRLSRRISAGDTPVYLGVGAWRLGAWGNAKGREIAGSDMVSRRSGGQVPRGMAIMPFSACPTVRNASGTLSSTPLLWMYLTTRMTGAPFFPLT